jgi:hypothetical protein
VLRPATAALAVALAAASAAASADEPIVVRAAPITAFDPSRPEITRFGALEWLGGVSLTSADARLGGLSGVVTEDGGRRILAVTDYGDWIAATVTLDDGGAPVALVDARVGRLAGPDGQPIRGKRPGDAEAIAVRTRADGGREVLVSFETPGHIAVYRDAPPFATTPRITAYPPALAQAGRNSRGEALAVVPAGRPLAGAVLVFAEGPAAAGETIPGGFIHGGKWQPVALAGAGNYALTDAAFLPDGDLLVLERRFGFGAGIRMRIRRIAADTIAAGAVLDGEVLIEAGFSQAIDNMEGMAVDTDAGGTVLTLVSDDNRSFLQRTLLLRFRLVE